MPSSLPACASSLVMAASSGLGVRVGRGVVVADDDAGDGLHDGGPEHLGRAHHRGVDVPLVDDALADLTWFLVLSSSTRSCSWASVAISGPSRLCTSSAVDGGRVFRALRLALMCVAYGDLAQQAQVAAQGVQQGLSFGGKSESWVGLSMGVCGLLLGGCHLRSPCLAVTTEAGPPPVDWKRPRGSGAPRFYAGVAVRLAVCRRRLEVSLSRCRPSPTPAASARTSGALSPLAEGVSPISERNVPDEAVPYLHQGGPPGTAFRQDQEPLLAGLGHPFQEQQAAPQVGGVQGPQGIVPGGRAGPGL